MLGQPKRAIIASNVLALFWTGGVGSCYFVETICLTFGQSLRMTIKRSFILERRQFLL